MDALVPSQSRWFDKSSFANCANKVLLPKMSFHVVRQFLLEVKPFVADGAAPILYSLVDQLMFGSGWRPPKHLVTRDPTFVFLLSSVFGHVHSKVVLGVATEVTIRARE